jgi:predicted chitinase
VGLSGGTAYQSVWVELSIDHWRKSVPPTSPRNVSPTPGQQYTIQAGDTLFDLATAAFGAANANQGVTAIEAANPGIDPANLQIGQAISIPAVNGTQPPSGQGFGVSEEVFDQLFPQRNAFYTYAGLVDAASRYPAFGTTGGYVAGLQEVAAFLANVDHETGGLVFVVEQDTSQYSHYCDQGQPYGCPAGESAYYGRGPLQLSWNFNYKAAGDALGVDLLDHPDLVATDASVAWSTALWFWMTQTGAGRMTAHDAMVTGAGFGETIRTINGDVECNGRSPDAVTSRVNSYLRITQVLQVSPGDNLSC